MRLDQLKLLLLLERYGTLSAVAKELNTTQSTISYNLKELERELDTALFIREGNHLKFSPKGRQLIPHIENIEQAKKIFSTSPKKHWQIMFFLEICLLAMIPIPAENFLWRRLSSSKRIFPVSPLPWTGLNIIPLLKKSPTRNLMPE